MIQDSKGRDIEIGSTVLLRLVVTNLIADSERVNLVCRHENPMPGVPDDWRLAVASGQVELVTEDQPAAPAAPELAPELVPET